MDSKSPSKKLPAIPEQGAVIKFSMPAGPESDEFYSNLVRKFGPDVVSRTVKENSSAMSPRSKAPTTESVCSLSKIEAVNDGFHQQLTATLKQDIDWNFIDFIIDYLLSSDKEGPQEADVDKLIQNYVKLNPQLREQLVNMLKNLAEGKEIRIEPSRCESAVIPKRSVKVKTDEVSMTAPSKMPKSPSSSRSPKRHAPNLSNPASKACSSSEVIEKPTPEAPPKAPTLDRTEGCLLHPSRIADFESPKSTAASASKLTKSTADGTDSTLKSSPKPTDAPTPSATPRSGQPHLQVGYWRVVGATTEALELLHAEGHCVDDIALVSTTPKRIDDSDCDEVFQFAGCTYDELTRLESAGSSAKKKKKKNKKKSKKKNHSTVDEEGSFELSAVKPHVDPGTAETSVESSMEDVRTAAANEIGAALADAAEGDQDVNAAVIKREEEYAKCIALLGGTPSLGDLNPRDVETCNREAPSTSSGPSSAVLAINKPLRLVKDIESRAPISLARSDILLGKEFKFQSVSQAECGVVTSWDDLKELVAEVFPNDSELQEAFATKADNSLDLWKFIVKYGRMYKDFVSEVLEMVNELKKGLIDAMDMHREKTNEILETHKKEMCSVVEKARAADYRIEVLEQELEDQRLSADDQKVRAFTQEEEIQKLQKDLTAKEKKLRDFDNVRKELLSERNKAKEERDRLAAEHEKTKTELLKSKSECDSLRTRLKRSREGAEETDYRLREFESKLGDEQAETEKLKESNAKLTKKTEALQNEIERLKEKHARQRLTETALRASTAPSLNTVPTSDGPRVTPSGSLSSCSSTPSVGSFFSSVISPRSSRSGSSQYTSGYFSSPQARAVGSPSSKMFPSSNNQSTAMRPSPYSAADPGASQMSKATYAAASAGNCKDAFGQNFGYRDSALAKQPREADSEVHSLLAPSESPVNYRNDFSPSNVTLNGDRVAYDNTESRILAGLRNAKPEVPVSPTIPSYASLFSKDESPAQPEVSYSPWGNPNYDFPSPAAPLLFNIKPSSLTVTPTGYRIDPPSRFPDSGTCSPAEISQNVVDHNATKPNQGYHDLFRL